MTSKGFSTDLSTWDGTISSSDFYVAARYLADKWKRLNSSSLPHWSWVAFARLRIPSREEDGYLSLENVLIRNCSKEDQDEDKYTETDEPCCSDHDDATLISLGGTMTPKEECFLVKKRTSRSPQFSARTECELGYIVHDTISSFKVPALYFRAYCSDGQPLGWDDIMKDIPESSVDELNKSKWTFITQEEHPYLLRPWYTLHPCATSEWMKLLLNCDSHSKGRIEIEQYLLSWLSVVGQAVGLRVPFEVSCNLER